MSGFFRIVLLSLLIGGYIGSEISFSEDGKINLYFFWGKGCPHCTREKVFLEGLKSKYPDLTVKPYEVWYDRENAKFLSRMAEAYGIDMIGVPITLIGDYEPIIGYHRDETTGKEIEEKVKHCIRYGCGDAVEKLYGVAAKGSTGDEYTEIELPLIGKVDISKLGLPALTIVIAGMDSFNPCAFFVLLTLLGILIHAQSRGRMLLIGGTFVFFSGFIYFLFMSAWLNIFILVGHLAAITVLAGMVSLSIALINIKDFFFFKRGFSPPDCICYSSFGFDYHRGRYAWNQDCISG